ncbi:C40 family peptidase [Metaclostridioides mangenotii]|uniref:C40 family peptidase n=1 Tax=Metaclostridioides mangenotii TaxID=1540 RepID=UPI0026F244F1|nr:C40 family peptidase [Clostridioides mangenotii]
MMDISYRRFKKIIAGVLIACFALLEGQVVAIAAEADSQSMVSQTIESSVLLNKNLVAANSEQNSKVKKVIDLAYKQKGKPYKWGATGPDSFDCSGFTTYVYKNAASLTLPRVSRDQAKAGTKVERNNLKEGDLVFFGSGGSITHVGMYVGDQQFIHSPQSGDVVKVTKMDTGSYSNRFITARRIIQE